MPSPEHHRSHRAGWLRAAVLGANDGVVSIAGLVVGVAASGAPATVVLASGVAGTVAGAFSMAAGEYVSVQSQADTEAADLVQERRELQDDPEDELEGLAGITATLAALGRNAIPVYALYLPGEASPRLLPELLTPSLVLEQVAALPAAQSSTALTQR
jgi:hypothetical protein